jgi:HTH-type transcriptional regulator/antitoxin HigA
MTTNTFSPDWNSPPGDTIQDAIAASGLTLEAFTAEVSLSTATAGDLLRGHLQIDTVLAERLADILGGSRTFWLKREEAYRARISHPFSGFADAEQAFIAQLPLRDMEAYGWLRPFERLPRAEAALAFFSDSAGNWRENSSKLADAAAFRTSSAHTSNLAAVAAWLRQGVLQASKIECQPWNASRLRSAITDLRALTRIKSPSKFFPQLVEMSASCGIAVVFVRTPKGCPASGATHFASPEKAILQLSFRYRSDDHFWFTFFHELGHLLLHGKSPLFVEGSDFISTDEETEANDFSSKVLIPADVEDEMKSLGRKFSAIMRFAKRIGVSPGIVVGQMQNRGILRHEQMNFLKERYDWSEVEAVSL